MAFSMTPTSDHHRYCSNMTPDVIIESSIPTPESNTSAPGALNSNSSQNRTNFHSFNSDNAAMGSPDDQSAASSSGGGGGGGCTGGVNGLPVLSENRGGNVIMETSFRVMSPESEMAAASLRTLQGISRLGCDPNSRQPDVTSAPLGIGGNVVTTGYAALNSPYYTQSSIYNNNSSTSRPATACHEYNPPQNYSQPPEIGFKTVDQSSGVNVSGGFRQSSGGGGGGGAVSYMPLTGSGSTTHIIEQPISQRPYSYEYPFTPPFPHQSQLTHGSRSHTPCSPPDQNFDKKNQTLSQSSISLPAIKGGGVGGGTGGVSEQMGSSSHHHHHNHHDIDHDCISLRHDSIRQSKASDVDVVTDLAADEKSITWGFVGGGGGLSGGGTMMREGTADVQPVLTWGFQLWECFSDTKWCIITGFFPCITEFILSQNFGLQKVGLSFVFSALGIVTLLLVQLFLVKDNHDSLNVGLNDGFICNLLLYALFLLRLYLAFKLRSRIRNEYQIEGNPVSDCCIACLCSYCALCQMKQHYDYYDGSDSEDESPDPPRMSASQIQHHSHSQHTRPPAAISYPKSRSVETCLNVAASSKNRVGVGIGGVGGANHRLIYTDNNRSYAKQSPLCHSGGRVYDNSFVHQNSASRGGCSMGGNRCQPTSYHCRHHGCCRNPNPLPSNMHQQVVHTCVVPQQCRSVWVTDAPSQAVLQDGTRINMPRY